MLEKIVRQPDGLYAVWSITGDIFTHYNMSTRQVLHHIDPQQRYKVNAGETLVLAVKLADFRWQHCTGLLGRRHGVAVLADFLKATVDKDEAAAARLPGVNHAIRKSSFVSHWTMPVQATLFEPFDFDDITFVVAWRVNTDEYELQVVLDEAGNAEYCRDIEESEIDDIELWRFDLRISESDIADAEKCLATARLEIDSSKGESHAEGL